MVFKASSSANYPASVSNVDWQTKAQQVGLVHIKNAQQKLRGPSYPVNGYYLWLFIIAEVVIPTFQTYY